jgi:hypothetical protein
MAERRVFVGEALKSAMLEQPEGSGLWTLKAAASMCTHFTQHVGRQSQGQILHHAFYLLFSKVEKKVEL